MFINVQKPALILQPKFCAASCRKLSFTTKIPKRAPPPHRQKPTSLTRPVNNNNTRTPNKLTSWPLSPPDRVRRNRKEAETFRKCPARFRPIGDHDPRGATFANKWASARKRASAATFFFYFFTGGANDIGSSFWVEQVGRPWREERRGRKEPSRMSMRGLQRADL